ncbi:MAG: hypothetical protein KBT41_01595, partial [bacterium]|nr:hypothetical protein [Candidatus Colousia faecequi]
GQCLGLQRQRYNIFPNLQNVSERKFATTQTIVVTQTLSQIKTPLVREKFPQSHCNYPLIVPSQDDIILDNDNFLNESGMLRKLSYKLFSKTNLQSARSVSKLVQTRITLTKPP